MRMKRFICFLLLCLSVSLSVSSQERIAKGTIVARHNVLPDNYNFWLYTPGDYDPRVHPVPLVF